MANPCTYADETEIILQELSHRIFNNFQIIASLTSSLQRETCVSAIHSKLNSLTRGLVAFANLHRSLLPEAGGSIYIALERVCRDVIQGFGREDIQVFTRIEDVPLSAVQHHRVLLIVAELITNALKHGFAREHDGAMLIALLRRGDTIILEASDSSACPAPAPGQQPSRLVSALARTLGGHAALFDRDGFATRVVFPFHPAQKTRGLENGTVIDAERVPVVDVRTGTPALA